MAKSNLLWDYQQLDNLIDKHKNVKKQSKYRDILLKLKKYLLKQQEQLKVLNDSVDKKSSIYRRIEREAEDLSYNLKEDQNKLYSGDIKNIKQLEQLQKNAKNYKKRIELKEEELIKLIEQIQEFEKELREIKAKVAKAKKEYKKIKEQYDEQLADADKEIEKISEERHNVEAKISRDLIGKYEIMKRHKRIVVAKIENGRCSGCNMSMPSIVLNELIEEDDIVECENCGRILCID